MFGSDARSSDDSGKSRRVTTVGGQTREERRVTAWIGESIVIRGDLTSSEDTTIAGRVEGDVAARSHTVVIAARARIEGNVRARAVVVHGEVVGTISASHRVEIGAEATIDGDVTAPRAAVSEGAALHGRLVVAEGRS